MIEITDASELDDFINSNDAVVIDFAKRNGCVPCARLKPHFEAAARSIDGVEFAVVYLDEMSQQHLFDVMENFGLRSTPTVFYIDNRTVQVLEARTGPLLIKEISSLL